MYACLTCLPESKEDPTKRAGICLACSYHCHDGHELIELFTKRNFRCDCGNSKFGDRKCNLCPIKDDTNATNEYNQNFSGVYCTCHRPYPDPEDNIHDEMIQCIACEDWYHTRHLDAKVPENYAEMMCGDCVKKHKFILNYEGLTVTTVNTELNTKTVETIDIGKDESTSDVGKITVIKTENNDDVESRTTTCTKPKLLPETAECAKFFMYESWRQKLCKCELCLKVYKDENISFINDPLDTVQTYEIKGNDKAEENEKELVQKFLTDLPRQPLLNTIAAYHDLKKNLGEFLKEFAENKKVVRVEDVKEFFSGMEARKKPKLDYQYYCG